MILFPMNPNWFALKFITKLRKHEKCSYKPSIRQAIAICNLILARLLNKGSCNVEDFIDIAVVTSPLENQVLARQIAKKILSFSESIEKGYGESSFSSNLFYNGKAKDLLDDIEDFDTNIEAIMDDFEFLKNYGKDLESFDINEVEDSLYNNFFEEFKHELEIEPYKTALDVIQKNASIDFDKINNLNSLLDLAKKVLSEKVNHLEPSDILDAKKLKMLEKILSKTKLEREKMLAEFAAQDLQQESNQEDIKKMLEHLNRSIKNTLRKKQEIEKKLESKIDVPSLNLKRNTRLEDIENSLSLANSQKKMLLSNINQDQYTDKIIEFLNNIIAAKEKEKSEIEAKAFYKAESGRFNESDELNQIDKLLNTAKSQKKDLLSKVDNSVQSIANNKAKNILKNLKEKLKNDFDGSINTASFLMKSEMVDEAIKNNIKKAIKESFSDQNRTVSDLFNASLSLGSSFEFGPQETEAIIASSKELPFKDVYQNCRALDRYFGGANITETYLNSKMEELQKKEVFFDLEETMEELISSPIKTPSWRKIVNELINQNKEKIKNDFQNKENQCVQMKSQTDNLISLKDKCSDLKCRTQVENKISEMVDNTIKMAPNPNALKDFVKSFRDLDFPPSTDSIMQTGRELNMPEEEIYNLIESKFKYFKYIVKKNKADYSTHKDSLKQLNLSQEQMDEVMNIALKTTENGIPNFNALTSLCEKDMSKAFNSAKRMGEDALDKVLSSLGAGSGLDLLEQWFCSRHNISPKIKLKLKQIIKQIMIDLGIRSANSLIGTANSGPIVENTVIPYSLGDDFELIDLEETISSLMESGKTVQMITNDDFLVSKTSQGLRCLVLELDVSGSMSGQKLSQMALCATMLVYAFKPEEIALTLFESNTHKLKDLDEDVELEKIVDELLDIESMGGTCIRSALKWANLQFEKKARSKYRLNILFTDADVFDFDDSIKELEKMKDKDVQFVMVVPKFGYSPVMARKMVDKANGVLLTLNQWREFPKLISDIISKQN